MQTFSTIHELRAYWHRNNHSTAPGKPYAVAFLHTLYDQASGVELEFCVVLQLVTPGRYGAIAVYGYDGRAWVQCPELAFASLTDTIEERAGLMDTEELWEIAS